MSAPDKDRLIAIAFDDESISRAPPDIEHERAVAIFDLIEDNSFALCGHEDAGPFRLVLKRADTRLVLDIRNDADEPIVTHILSLTPLRRIVKDYFVICDSYYEAIKAGAPSRIEAIDMGRRGVHNEGSQMLMDRLKGKIDVNFDTARRLFTLVCVLHWRG